MQRDRELLAHDQPFVIDDAFELDSEVGGFAKMLDDSFVASFEVVMFGAEVRPQVFTTDDERLRAEALNARIVRQLFDTLAKLVENLLAALLYFSQGLGQVHGNSKSARVVTLALVQTWV